MKTFDEIVDAAERDAILDALAEHRGVLAEVGRALGLSPTRLYRLLAKHRLKGQVWRERERASGRVGSRDPRALGPPR